MSPVWGSRGAIHSGARRRRGGTLAFFDLIVYTMPSSSKRWYAFLSVYSYAPELVSESVVRLGVRCFQILTSLLTASK